ncbi:MAG: hypothetical protein HYY36_04915 [Gammaproteobacteria bacterium]|nr:hypothetical protein [Gammaproteobacteria bacterium]
MMALQEIEWVLPGRLDWRAAVRGRHAGARGRTPSRKALDLLPEIQARASGLKRHAG